MLLDEDLEAHQMTQAFEIVLDEKHPFSRPRFTGNNNAFQEVEYLFTRVAPLPYLLAITLLKIKMLIDLPNVKNASLLSAKLPQELVDNVKTYVPRSPLLAGNRLPRKLEVRSALMDKLNKQIVTLYHRIKARQRYLWQKLVDGHDHRSPRREAGLPNDKEEVQFVLDFAYDAWIETPGSIDEIKDMMFVDQLDQLINLTGPSSSRP